MIDLTRKIFVVFGFREAGKSVLSANIGNVFGDKCLFYDTLNDWHNKQVKFDIYSPINRNNPFELEAVTKAVMANPKYTMFIIDEANRHCPSKPKPLPQAIADLNDWCRHPPYSMGAGFIARRPTQLNQDITELADYMFIFQLGGKNDIKFLNDLSDGLGDTVRKLPKYHFALVKPNRSYEVCNPVAKL